MKLIWLIVAILFAVAELMTTTLTLIWFSIGAVILIFLSSIIDSILIQIIIFAIISIVPNIKMIISMWGSRTLNVYVLHYIFLYFFFGLLDGKNFVKIYFSNNPGMVLIPLSILLTIVLSLKIWIRPMNFLLKPHKK